MEQPEHSQSPIPLGWFLRALHGWGSNFMVAIVLIHMAQVFLFGAYKFPRELTWILGVFLLLMTLGMAFTGQVLRFDQDAYWGLGIGASIMSRVPSIGGGLVHLLLGGPIIAGATLSRFFALHVFIIPGTLLLRGAARWMVLKLGINEWPMPGRVVRRSTYIEEYNKLAHEDGIPFVPAHSGRTSVFSAAIRQRLPCALLPSGRSAQRPARSHHHSDRSQARFLLPLDLRGTRLSAAGSMETPSFSLRPSSASRFCWRCRSGRRRREELASAARRDAGCLPPSPYAGQCSRSSAPTTPWSPHMNAWSSDPLPVAICTTHAAVRQGALFSRPSNAATATAIGGVGGERGPALDDVATRMTDDQLRLQGGYRRREHAGIRQESFSRGDRGAGRVSETLHPASEPPAADLRKKRSRILRSARPCDAASTFNGKPRREP